MQKSDKALLSKIYTDTQDISEFIHGHDKHSFLNNRLVQNAVVMSLLKIGERASHLSNEFVANMTNIPWKQIVRLRHIAAHEYEALRLEDIWVNVTNRIPEIQQQIKTILEKD